MDRNDQSVTTSIADLYKAAANPMRTNVGKIRRESTPFVSSQIAEEEEEDVQSHESEQSHQSRSARSSRSVRSERSVQSADERIRSYVSRRSFRANERMHNIRNDPVVQQQRQPERDVNKCISTHEES